MIDPLAILIEVTAGNWGATSIASRLQHRSDWYDMMRWCIWRGYVGELLWLLYKDVFDQDLWAMGDYIRWQMRADAQHGFDLAVTLHRWE